MREGRFLPFGPASREFASRESVFDQFLSSLCFQDFMFYQWNLGESVELGLISGTWVSQRNLG